jgi:fido (protein-threonine AMPylation protein)
MAYIYRKIIGGKSYYYLRASLKKNDKMITKDIKYLGNDISTIKDNLQSIPAKYSEEIRKTYKTINRFLEVNTYLERIKKLKIKNNDYLDKESLENIESCKIHWNEKFQPLDKTTKEESLKNFIIEFAFNTTSIEGNTITLKQAQNLLLDNLTPKNKTLREIYDLQNTERVFIKTFNNPDKEISHETICTIHDELLENIDARKGYRTTDVRVFKANFKSTPAPYVKTDMNILLKWYKENKNKIHPFALAIIFHHKFEKIHPFMDGNGRTGRMLLNRIMLKNTYPPTIIRKKNRLAYLEKLHKADDCPLTRATPEEYKPLIEFGAKEMTENYWNIFL